MSCHFIVGLKTVSTGVNKLRFTRGIYFARNCTIILHNVLKRGQHTSETVTAYDAAKRTPHEDFFLLDLHKYLIFPVQYYSRAYISPGFMSTFIIPYICVTGSITTPST